MSGIPILKGHKPESAIQAINLSNLSDFDLPFVPLSDKIPYVIYQTWKTKDLPSILETAVQNIKEMNPGFKHELYDDNDCREFIKNFFPVQILFAYDTLVPGAYKADLWRYCILYLRGGIYIDIKYSPVGKFSFLDILPSEHLCKDRGEFFKNKNGVYNAVMIMKAGNPILKECIHRIFENCYTRNYGHTSLYPTGPGLMGEIIPVSFIFTLYFTDDSLVCDASGNGILYYDNYEYRKFMSSVNPNTYNDYHRNKNIYKDLKIEDYCK
jgi:mannosyltransferase OCH1-like enzyme